MSNIFNEDFREFLAALNDNEGGIFLLADFRLYFMVIQEQQVI